MDGRTRSFDTPDETITLPHLRYDLVTVGAIGVARTVHEPGWRWSEHVRPSAATEACETRHIGYCLRGRLGIRLQDNSTYEVGAGDVYDIPPGHDGWVVGDEAVEVIEWVGARSWLRSESAMPARVLATIVFTDIVGSTVTARAVGDGVWADVIGSFGTVTRELVNTYGGVTVKSTGDGFLAIFDGAARALRAALALRAGATDLGLVTRTAVHTGEIEQAEGDVHGISVHEAARMLDLTEHDEILVSATTQSLTQDAGMSFTDRGQHELRGFEGRRTVFALG